jgi:hypothetical protein
MRASGMFHTSQVGLLLDNSYIMHLMLGNGTGSQGLKAYLENFGRKALITPNIITEAHVKFYDTKRLKRQQPELAELDSPLRTYDELVDSLCVKVEPEWRPYRRRVDSLYKQARIRFRRRVREMSTCLTQEALKRAQDEMEKDPAYDVLDRKLFKEKPSEIDLRMLAEAAVLRRSYPSLYLVSADQAIVPVLGSCDVVLATLIPDMIYERFGVTAAREDAVAKVLFEMESNGVGRPLL